MPNLTLRRSMKGVRASTQFQQFLSDVIDKNYKEYAKNNDTLELVKSNGFGILDDLDDISDEYDEDMLTEKFDRKDSSYYNQYELDQDEPEEHKLDSFRLLSQWFSTSHDTIVDQVLFEKKYFYQKK